MKDEKEFETRLTSSHRKDIQGLRAISVFAVVVFHAGWLMPSGFIGVDLFFVISGYVISGLLIRELHEKKRVDLLHFYVRRIYRLLPALGTMVFAITISVFLLMSPLGMQQNAVKTGIGSLLISANREIAILTQGYFDLPAQSNPFLHTWSLSVEEQFYLFFPLLILLLAKLPRKLWKVLLSVLILALFSISLFIYVQDGQIEFLESTIWLQGFYSPLGRVWEFSLGVAAQIVGNKFLTPMDSRKHSYLQYLLCAIILISLFQPQSTFKFPSLNLFIPVISLAIFLVLRVDTSITHLLESRIFNFIGDRSYSIYLWHWPFLVLAAYIFPESILFTIAALLTSFLIACLTYRFIENPLRVVRNRNFSSMTKLVTVFLVLPVLLCGSVGYVSSEILFKRYESGSIGAHYEGDIGAIGFESFSSLHPSDCTIPPNFDLSVIRKCKSEVLVIGDSHAQHLLPGFAYNYPNIRFSSLGSNIFTLKGSLSGRQMLSEIERNQEVKVVVINGYWSKNGVPEDLRTSIKAISASGKAVVLLDDIPNFPFDAFTCKFGISPFIGKYNCDMVSKHFVQQREKYIVQLRKAVSGIQRADLIITSDEYCSQFTCSMVKNGELHYLDLNHLNTLGSKYLTKVIARKSETFMALLETK